MSHNFDLKQLARLAGFNPEFKGEGLCICCGRVALDHSYSPEGRREVEVSGLCEECFDQIMLDTQAMGE